MTMLQVNDFLEDNAPTLKHLISLELILKSDNPSTLSPENARLLCDEYTTFLEKVESNLLARTIPHKGLEFLLWGSVKYKLAYLAYGKGEESKAIKILGDLLNHFESCKALRDLITLLRDPDRSGVIKLPMNLSVVFNTIAGLLQLIFNLHAACYRDADNLDQKSCIEWLLSARRVYELYSSTNPPHLGPIFWETLLFDALGSRNSVHSEQPNTGLIELSKIMFEYGYTSTLFMMAQYYQMTENPCKAANYCRLTLAKQLQWSQQLNQFMARLPEDQHLAKRSISPTRFLNPRNVCALKYDSCNLIHYPCSVVQQFDPVEWALNAAYLANYFATQQDCYSQTLECLVTALVVLEQLSPTGILSKSNSKTQSSKPGKIQGAQADIYRGLGQYGLTLLERGLDLGSDNQLNNDNESGSTETFGSMFNQNMESILLKLTKQQKQQRQQQVSNQDKKPDEQCNNCTIRTNTIRTLITPPQEYAQALLVFQMVLQCLTNAERWYTLQDRCSDAVGLTRSRSKAYKLLAQFETDLTKQCCMHKKRIDLLENVLKHLNPQYYLLLCRQLKFESAEAMTTLTDLKQKIFDQTPVNNPELKIHYAKKTNILIKRAIRTYEQFLDLFRKPDLSREENFSEDDIRPILASHFYMARLYSRFIGVDITEKIGILSKALDHYKQVVQIAESHISRHPASQINKSEELPLAREMIELLPCKIDRLRRGDNLD